MLNRNLFRRPRNALEGAGEADNYQSPEITEELYVSCPNCKAMHAVDDLGRCADVCPACGHHFRIGARRRIALLAYADSFEELWPELEGGDPISF